VFEDIAVPLLLAGNMGEIHGRTRLQKLIFLVQDIAATEETSSSNFGFELYRYGPYSRELSTQLNVLVSKGYLRMDPEPTISGHARYCYSLTPEGKTLLNDMKNQGMFDHKLQDVISKVSDKYGELKLPKLVRVAYKHFRQDE